MTYDKCPEPIEAIFIFPVSPFSSLLLSLIGLDLITQGEHQTFRLSCQTVWGKMIEKWGW
jgi:hypothetical protein